MFENSKDWAISSEIPNNWKTFNDQSKDVHSSEWKQEAPRGDDMVCSVLKDTALWDSPSEVI